MSDDLYRLRHSAAHVLAQAMKRRDEDSISLSKRMKPEERIVAHFRHSQLMNRIYQAGVDYRKRFRRKK